MRIHTRKLDSHTNTKDGAAKKKAEHRKTLEGHFCLSQTSTDEGSQHENRSYTIVQFLHVS